MRSAVAAVLVTIVLGGTAAFFPTSSPSLAKQGTPAAAMPIVISGEVLGQGTPVDVADPLLALGRVTIMPGAAIPIHHHPGTQVGAVVQGTLTYSVISGSVEWQHMSDPVRASTVIEAGETVQVPAGDAVVEHPGAIHQGRNDGDTPVVIYVSTLFPAGAPRAIVDAATPTP